MEKLTLESAKKKHEGLNHLGVYEGKRYTLEFFQKPTKTSNDAQKKLDLSASLCGDTYYILIDQEVFEAGLKDNQSALKELSRVRKRCNRHD